MLNFQICIFSKFHKKHNLQNYATYTEVIAPILKSKSFLSGNIYWTYLDANKYKNTSLSEYSLHTYVTNNSDFAFFFFVWMNETSAPAICTVI